MYVDILGKLAEGAVPVGRMTNGSSVTLLYSVLTISSDQLLETKQSDEQGGLRLFSGGFYFVYMSSFFMVSIFLSQWSAVNRALLCSGCWDKLSFFEATFLKLFMGCQASAQQI